MRLGRSHLRLSAGLLAAAGLAAGCGGHVNKAGGSIQEKPLVLTLAAHAGDEEDAQPFAAAVDRLSGGALQIQIRDDWRSTENSDEVEYDRRMVSDVRAGKAQLAIVGARGWDTLGVTSFQALLAPFLIDSLELERRAIETPFAARALARIERAGVVGVALLPGRLRRPLGLTRPLVRLEDYRGVTIGIRPGDVAAATLRALGARPKGYIPGFVADLDGAELDPLTISENSYDQAGRALTANVVLWPKPLTIVANKAAFGGLTAEQRQILLAAGRDAVAPTLDEAEREQQLGLSTLCTDKFPLRSATAAELTALREAVQPVYEWIEHDPLTRQWIAAIERMRASAAPDTARCTSAGARSVAKSALDGRWTFTWPEEELRTTCPECPPGRYLVEFRDGRLSRLRPRRVVVGRVTVLGKLARFVFEPSVPGVVPGQASVMRFSIYRDRLTWSSVPGRPSLDAFLVTPWIRVR